MADLIATERSNIVAIADAVRSKIGTTEEMTIDGIISGIENIETGIDLPELTTSTATVELTDTGLPTYPVYYIGIDGAISATHNDAPFTCIAPSIMALKDGGRKVSTNGSISLLLKDNSVSAYLINGNGTIIFTSAGTGSDD